MRQTGQPGPKLSCCHIQIGGRGSPGEGLLHCACAAFPTGTGHLLHLLGAQHPACLSSGKEGALVGRGRAFSGKLWGLRGGLAWTERRQRLQRGSSPALWP